jgi:hypothetical protein
VRVTVIATGFDHPRAGERQAAEPAAKDERLKGSTLLKPEDKPTFEIDEDVLDIPSFLKTADTARAPRRAARRRLRYSGQRCRRRPRRPRRPPAERRRPSPPRHAFADICCLLGAASIAFAV